MDLKELSHIAIGYKNLLLDKIDLSNEEISALSEKRMKVCYECPFFNKVFEICKKCNCYMPAGTKVKDKKCPENFW